MFTSQIEVLICIHLLRRLSLHEQVAFWHSPEVMRGACSWVPCALYGYVLFVLSLTYMKKRQRHHTVMRIAIN